MRIKSALAALSLALLVNVIQAQSYACRPDQWQCDNGDCIDQSKRCNGRLDCPSDHSDERNCEPCVVTDDKICDKIRDCLDGSDESPELCRCDDHEFTCKREKECINKDLVCDGYSDCKDESDEDDCGEPSFCKGQFQCDNKECVNREFMCDGFKDCTDESDEKNCECRPGYWRCSSGECIPYYLKCNQNFDCNDYSDERDCPGTPNTAPPLIPPLQTTTQEPRRTVTTYYPPYPTIPPGQTVSPLPIDIRIEDNPQIVKEGEDVVFRCRDYGTKRVHVEWVREGNVPFQYRHVDKGGRLELYSVTTTDAGNYICRPVQSPNSPPSRNDYDAKRVYLTVRRRDHPVRLPPPECGPDQTQCNDRKCIPKTAICDGRNDCSDGSDELACSDICEPNQFRCANRRCILVSWRCDSFDDCSDNSDELGCPPARGRCGATEFACGSGECVGKNVHCDGTNDCRDGSDEVGCTPVHIFQPPPRSKFLARGEDMVITCMAVGVPPPVIVWRFNWGHIPHKCSYTQDSVQNANGATVVGTLTCPGVQYEDQGAYSCEGINTKASVFAVPDTILTVNGSSSGAVCPTGYFNSRAESMSECISCFCFGVTTKCRSADLYTYQIPTPLGEGGTFLLGLEQRLSQLIEHKIFDQYDYQSRSRNEATVTKLMNSPRSDIHPYLALPESYNEMQLTSYGGYIKYTLRPHNRKYQYSNMPDIVIKGKHTTLVYHEPEDFSSGYSKSEINREVRLLPPYWSKVTQNGIKQATREDIMMALDNVERILLRADFNDGGVNITNFKMDSAQRENLGLGQANFVEECECPAGYEGLSCHKCNDGFERINSGPWLGLCKRVDEVCPPGTYGDPRRGIPCHKCPCPLTEPSNNFAGTCYLDTDGQVTCDCNTGYDGRRCEVCAPGYEGNPMYLGDYCREKQPSYCNPYGTEREIDGRCICKQKVEGTYCDKCTKDSFLLSPDNMYGCAQCFCMGMTDQCSSSNLRRSTITSRFASQQDVTDIYVIQGSPTKYKDPKRANITPQLDRNELVLNSLDLAGSKTYYWSVPKSLTGNKVTSYGGFLTYSLSHNPPAKPQNLYNSPAAVTIFSKNLITVHNFGNVSMTAYGSINGSVQLIETNWRRSDGKPVQRSDLLMALADVEKILIRATYTFNTQEARFSSASIEIAEPYGTGSRADHVEECRCPKNYTGTSCENCSPGYTRGSSGIYLANCEECDCNGKSNQCHPETGVCVNCRENTAGDHCEECAEGFANDNGYCREVVHTGDCNCDPRGQAGPCYENGQCRCKQNVEGERCNVCRPGTFNLDDKNPAGCTQCYCSGVSNDCQSANNYNRIRMPVTALNEEHGFSLQTIDADYVINDNIILNQEASQLGYIFGNEQPSDKYYWSIPVLPGNRITSYGGNLGITQKFESGDYPDVSDADMSVLLVSDHAKIYWNNPKTFRSGETAIYEVPLIENNWRDLSDGSQVRRDHFLSVLASLRRVLVLASLSPGVTSTYIADVYVDTAIENLNAGGAVNANDIELCHCPPGYKGTSCEQCESGFYRTEQGTCQECPCKGNADSCQLDANGQVVCNCRLPYSGWDCSEVEGASQITTHRTPSETTVTVQIIKPLIKIYSIGSTVNYTCTARSRLTNTPLTVTWKKNGGHLPLNRAYTDDRTGSLVIEQAQVTDSGTYVCEANDGVTINQEYVSLTVSPNPNSRPVVRIEHPYTSGYEGDLITLKCITSGIPKPGVTWVRKGQALPYDSEMNDGILTIPSARISDSGEYRCLARNPAGSAESVAMITVARRPEQDVVQLTVSPSQPNIQEGQSTRITCKSSSRNVSPGSLIWTRENRQNLPSNFEAIEGTLYINNPIPDDNDVYVCRSSSTEFTITPVRVQVSVRPVEPITSRPGDEPGISLIANTTTIPTGGNAFIECIPRGYPLPIVKWKKHNGVFRPGISQRGNALVISNAEDLDRGYYICEATLPDGEQLNPSYLIVYIEKREKPEVSIWPSGLHTVELGQNFDLMCSVNKGIPEPIVTWSRKSSRGLSTTTQILPENTLRFTNISINDEGEYICTASNIVGEAAVGTTLKVQSPPKITITPASYFEVNPGESIRVDCRSTGYPEPTVYWKKEFQNEEDQGVPTPTIATLAIDRVSRNNQGTYTCVAQSPAGTRKEQISISVNYEDDNSIDSPGPIYQPTSRPERPNNNNVVAVYAPVGANFNLNCETGPLDPDVEVKWTRLDGYPLSPYVVRQNRLVWDRITKEDEGTYQCSILDRYSQIPKLAAQKQLIVQRPPVISLNPPSQVVRPHDEAVVECVVDGDEPIEVKWEAASGYFSPRVNIENTKLRFNQIEVEDAGKYTCYAWNRVATATGTAEVKVTDGPRTNERVIIDRPSYPAVEGSNVIVTCRAYPNSLQLSWVRPTSSGNMQYANHLSQPGLSTLDIQNVQRSDAGVYRCIGRSRNREVYDDFDLNVEPAKTTPAYPQEDKLVEANLGSSVRLTCTDNGERLSNVEWRHEFGPILNVTESELILHNITEADSGTYTCRWMTENHAIDTQTVLKVINAVPMFNGDSWLSLRPMPAADIFNKMTIEIALKPIGRDGIVIYNSEKNSPLNDFIALRLIDAVPEFQFNSGMGVTTLSADRPLEMNKWHMIRISRTYNKLSMTVDHNEPDVKESKSKGYGLELNEPIYIGGVPSDVQLPNSLTDVTPVGFTGCVSMLILNAEEKSLMREKIDDSGNLAECNTCNPYLCDNGGICQETANQRGYSCLCKAGFSGHSCNRTGQACRQGLCGPGKCHDTADSYKCTCPNTHRGKNCEISQTITYPAFTGSGFLSFEPLKGSHTIRMKMKIKPMAPITDGILMYCAESMDGNGGFASLAVKDRYVEFMFDIGGSDPPTVLRSAGPLRANEVTEIGINRSLKQIVMTINNLETVNASLPSTAPMRWVTPLYIGGYDEKSVILSKKIDVTGGFSGCIQDVSVFPDKLDINKSKGFNVRECGSPGIERGDIPYYEMSTTANEVVLTECQCRNNGQCRRDGSCICPEGYYGSLCEHRSSTRRSCYENLCLSGGTCRETPEGYVCDCQLGFTGKNCQTNVTLRESAQFRGDGHLVFPSDLLRYDSQEEQTMAFMIKTDRDGLILYQHSYRRDGVYILLKIESGLATLNLNLGSYPITLRHSANVIDDQPHSIVVSLNENTATVTVDGEHSVFKTAPIRSTISEIDSEIYVGGIPKALDRLHIPGFSGCIQQIEFHPAIASLQIGRVALSGAQVDQCPWG